MIKYLFLILILCVVVNATVIVDPPVDVLVIGAGTAGIAASRKFQDAGLEFKILEWSNRIGGRVHTVFKEGYDAPAELGAMWMQEMDRNPTFQITEEYNIDTKKFDQGSVSIFTAGVLLTPEQVGAGVTKYYEIKANATQYIALGVSQQQTFEMAGYHGDDPFVELVISFFDEQYYADNPNRRDSTQWDYFVSIKPDRIVLDGYDTIHQTLVQDSPSFESKIQYNSKVVSIEATDPAGTALVTYKKRVISPSTVGLDAAVDEDATDGCNDVDVDDETKWNTHTVVANDVLCTASLAVLRSNKITFDPPMPAPMRHSVDTLLAGVADKMVLYFDYNLGRKALQMIKTNYIMRTSSVVNPRINDGLMVFINGWQVYRQPVIISFYQGDYARHLETLSDVAVKDLHMTALREIYGGSTLNTTFPDPVAYKRSNWGSRNNYGMVYTDFGVGSTVADFDALKPAIGVTGNVYLSGEHVAEPNNGYVHGADINGEERAALIIAKRQAQAK